MKIFNSNITKRDLIPPIILKILGKEVEYTTRKYYYNDILKTYSQYNEDLIIDTIFKCKDDGFYVDVGANSPEIGNNTKRFYDRGWNGINIEPNPQLYEILSSKRIKDINLNIGIGTDKSIIPFYLMTADTISSFDKESAMKSGKIHGAELKAILEIAVFPLQEVFDEYLNNTDIDFLSIDTEGYDLKVLVSNNWNRYRPHLVVIETGGKKEMIINYLTEKNYILVFDNYTNAIFLDKFFSL
jgi:FkbM family methyltransferase